VLFQNLWIKPAFMGQYSIYEGAREQNYLLGSPRLGLLWQGEGSWSGVDLEVGLGRYFRTPSMVELFGNGYGLESSMQLLPETAERGVIGFKVARKLKSEILSELKFQLSYGLVKAHQLIVYVENSQESKVATNLGSALIHSRDLDLGFKVLSELDFQTGLSWFVGENRSDVSYYQGKKIPSVPVLLVKQRVQYPWGPLNFSYQFQWVGERYVDFANLKKLNPAAEHSCFVSWDARDWGIFNLELFNLLDTITTTSVVSGFTTFDNTTGLVGYPAPGRRIYLNWQYPI
jgi:outer membrane cobalamin receptor